MKKYLISTVLISSLLFSCQTGEDKSNVMTETNTDSLEKEALAAANNYTAEKDSVCKCIDTNLFDPNKFLPPFDKSEKVVLYDFNTILSPGTSTKTWEGLLKGSPINKNVKAIEVIKEIELTDDNKKELQHILFDKIEKCSTDKYSTLGTDCLYDPHHCFVFFDKKGVAIDFLEICFICDARRSSRKNEFGSFCGNTYCDLREFAKKLGVDKKRVFGEWCK
ncbi:MAG: hypothetical protein V4635_05985 [Bacteroidota bacterium]